MLWVTWQGTQQSSEDEGEGEDEGASHNQEADDEEGQASTELMWPKHRKGSGHHGKVNSRLAIRVQDHQPLCDGLTGQTPDSLPRVHLSLSTEY